MWTEVKKGTMLLMIVTSCTLLLPACHKEKKKKVVKQHVVVAKLHTPVQRLYYSGTLSPIRSTPVVSNVSGNVKQMVFSYGEKVKKGETLMIIESSPLAQSYRSAVKDYLQQKQTYNTGKLQFEASAALYHAGINSKSQYLSDQSNFESQALTFSQSRLQLEKVLKLADVDAGKVEKLSLADLSKVEAILSRHFRKIHVYAPVSGIALYPSGGSEGGSESQLSIGDEIKEHQLLLLIGDLSGLSAKFSVSEVDIDRVKKNMPVTVTSTAFPSITLHGYVSAISSQASQGGGYGSGISMFAAALKVPKLPPEALKKIRIGMTAKFEIDIKGQKQVMLPINAVIQKNGRTMVMMLDKKGKKKTVSVITGQTTPTRIVILSGVNPGDRVLVND